MSPCICSQPGSLGETAKLRDLAIGFEAVPRGEKGVKESRPAKKVPLDLAGGGYPLTVSVRRNHLVQAA